MQITGVTSIPATSIATAPAPKPAAASETKTVAPASSSSHPSGSGQSGSGTAQASQLNTVAAVYSTTVAGTSYSGSVEQSGGQYSVTIPNLPGATATGSSIQAAENSLTFKIDILV